LLLVAAWLVLFGSFGWITVRRYCAEHYDFGIYVQALGGFSWRDLNPWLSARGVHIFNDHFDPILLAGLVFRLVFSPSVAALLTEQAMVLGSILPVLWLWKKEDLGSREAFTLCALLLLSAGTVDAALFPVHPTTWTLLPAMLIGAGWVRRSDLLILAGLVLLFGCKEEHVFCGPFVAFGLWSYGRRRAAWIAAAITASWASFVFIFRPLLFGPTIPYFQSTVAAFWSAPGAALLACLRAPELRRLGTLLAPFALLVLWAIRHRRASAWALLLSTLPLLASRFLAAKWTYQYGPPLIALWAAAFIPSVASARLPRWVTLGTVLLLLTSIENPLRKALRQLQPSAHAICSKDPARLGGLNRGIAFLREHRDDAAIVSSTLVAPLADRPEIYALGSSQRLSHFRYRYLFVEKPPYGYDWPLEPKEVAKILDDYLRKKDTRVILENEYVLLAEGDF
jgi:uncharacterized membrane protein